MKNHPVLDENITERFTDMEMQGGVDLEKLPPGTTLLIQTQSRIYTLLKKEDGEFMIKGHPEYCPEFIRVTNIGTSLGGSSIVSGKIYRGGYLEYRDPTKPVLEKGATVTTSQIREITEVKKDE